MVRGILCGARRAAQNCRTADDAGPSPSGDDAGDDLLAAHRVGRAKHAHVRDARHLAQHRSTSSGCTFRPATLMNDETRPVRTRSAALVEPAEIAGQEPAVRERAESSGSPPT